MNENRGVTRACSKCGTGIASRIRFLGLWWELDVYCRNAECRSRETIKLGQKAVISVASAGLLFLTFFISYNRIQATKITCDSFRTPDRTRQEAQNAAQKFYDSDPARWAKLDGWDKDGKVCE